jgi:hypothetical protein
MDVERAKELCFEEVKQLLELTRVVVESCGCDYEIASEPDEVCLPTSASCPVCRRGERGYVAHRSTGVKVQSRRRPRPMHCGCGATHRNHVLLNCGETAYTPALSDRCRLRYLDDR